jgi:hypothetical protein
MKNIFLLTCLMISQSVFSQKIYDVQKLATTDSLTKKFEGKYRKFDFLKFDHRALNALLKKDKGATFELNVAGGGADVEDKPC